MHSTIKLHAWVSQFCSTHFKDSFQISESFDGSAISYLINFTNFLTGSSCGTATLPASSCVEGICTYTPESFTCLPLPSGINVTVLGQNVLGNGAESHPITISTMLDLNTTNQSISCSGHVSLEFLTSMIALILLNIVTAIIASIIIFMLVKSKQKIRFELQRSQTKANEEPHHGLYEELDNVQMHTDSCECSNAISLNDNVSYSTKDIIIADKKAVHSELSLWSWMIKLKQ